MRSTKIGLPSGMVVEEEDVVEGSLFVVAEPRLWLAVDDVVDIPHAKVQSPLIP